MMKRLVTLIFFLSLLVGVAALVLPGFIDWNQHKDALVTRLSSAFTQPLSVAGAVSFKILPQPEIMLEKVTLGDVLTLEQLGARVRLYPLLQGRVEVESVDLVKPVFNLNVSQQGKTNWTDMLKDSPVGGIAGAVELNQVRVSDGAIRYTNRATGRNLNIDNLTLAVSASTLYGPYRIAGEMNYRNQPVKIDITSEKYDGASPVPVNIALLPTENKMPAVRLSGAFDLKSGFDIQGEMTISGGTVASLFNLQALDRIAFLKDTAELRGVVALKAGAVALTDIKGKIGGGEVRGKLGVQLPRGGRVSVNADLELSNVTLLAAGGDTYMDVPRDFDATLKLRGKNISWNGRTLSTLNVEAAADEKNWTIKSAEIGLAGGTRAAFSGIMNPSNNAASYTVSSFSSDDFGWMGLKKVAFSGGLNISQDRISLFNLDGAVDDGMKFSGVVNVDKDGTQAKLNLDNWKDSPAIVAALKKVPADLELNFRNLTREGITFSQAVFRGKIAADGTHIRMLTGMVQDAGSFAISGELRGNEPDINYAVSATKMDEIARVFGVDVPPALILWPQERVKGTLKGKTFTIQGDGIFLDGVSEVKLSGKRELAPDRAFGLKPFAINVTGETLLWQEQEISSPRFALKGDGAAVTVSGLQGKLWEGDLKADMSFTKEGVTMHGSLKKIDLSKLQEMLALEGFEIGNGDVDFDLSSTGGIAEATGTLDVKADKLKINDFNPASLGADMRKLADVPVNLTKAVNDSLKRGSAVFKDISARLNLDQGRLGIGALRLVNGDMKMDVSGMAEKGTYRVSAAIKLGTTASFPTFKVERKAGEAYAVSNLDDIKTDIVRHKPVPVVEVPDVKTLPSPAAALPPIEREAIDGVIERLETP